MNGGEEQWPAEKRLNDNIEQTEKTVLMYNKKINKENILFYSSNLK
jgi:hypothetical protein